MNLSTLLKTDVDGIRAELAAVREMVSAIGHDVPALSGRATGILQRFCSIACHVTSMETIAGAGRITGSLEALPKQERAESLPLFAAASAPPPSAPPSLALLQSLHRAGDHTLDPAGNSNNS